MVRGRIHESSLCIGRVEIGDGSWVGPFCILGETEMLTEVPHRQGLPDAERDAEAAIRIGIQTRLESHVTVGKGTIIGRYVWCDSHTHIGTDVRIADNALILYGARIYDRVSIGEESWVGGFVCNDSVISRGAVMLGSLVHTFKNASEGEAEAAPLVGEEAFVGMNATVIGGVKIGARSYVGAGAVVTCDVPPGRLYWGVPAIDCGVAPHPFRGRKREAMR